MYILCSLEIEISRPEEIVCLVYVVVPALIAPIHHGAHSCHAVRLSWRLPREIGWLWLIVQDGEWLVLMVSCACGCGGSIVWEMARSGKSFIRFCGFMLGKVVNLFFFLPHFLRRVRI